MGDIAVIGFSCRGVGKHSRRRDNLSEGVCALKPMVYRGTVRTTVESVEVLMYRRNLDTYLGTPVVATKGLTSFCSAELMANRESLRNNLRTEGA